MPNSLQQKSATNGLMERQAVLHETKQGDSDTYVAFSFCNRSFLSFYISLVARNAAEPACMEGSLEALAVVF